MTPQITLYLDTAGTLHAEAPGKNGMRRKLKLDIKDNIYDTLRTAGFVLAEELLDQRRTETKRKEIEAQRQQELERSRHVRIVEYTAAHYPSALKFIDPNVLRATPAMRKKLRADGYSDSDINLMAERGELIGTAFFTMPRASASPQQEATKKSARSAELDKIALAVSQIQL